MTTFTEKPASYTVNTAHAKCPNILYMIDEASGTTLVDRGKDALGLDMTLQNADQWTTVDLTSGGGTSPAISTLTARYALSGTGLSVTSAICFVAIMQSDDATNPAASETVLGAGSSASNSYSARVYSTAASDGFVRAGYVDPTASNAKPGSTDVWDGAFHMIAGKIYENGADVRMAASHDGGAWSTTAAATGTSFNSLLNRLGIGARATSSNIEIFTGKVVAGFVYLDDSASWTDTWISEVYNSGDPWQFLTTGAAIPVLMNQYRQRRA